VPKGPSRALAQSSLMGPSAHLSACAGYPGLATLPLLLIPACRAAHVFRSLTKEFCRQAAHWIARYPTLLPLVCHLLASG